jgi:ribosomal protein S27E
MSAARKYEIVVSDRCGHAREVKVANDSDRREARGMRCNDCRKYSDEVFERGPRMVPCARCGRERQVNPSCEQQIRDAYLRTCKSCASKYREAKSKI